MAIFSRTEELCYQLLAEMEEDAAPDQGNQLSKQFRQVTTASAAAASTKVFLMCRVP